MSAFGLLDRLLENSALNHGQYVAAVTYGENFLRREHALCRVIKVIVRLRPVVDSMEVIHSIEHGVRTRDGKIRNASSTARELKSELL